MKQITGACRDYEKVPKNSVAEEIGFLYTQPLNEHPLPLLHYCGMGDRPRDSSIFQNQLKPCCVHIRPGCAGTMGAIITIDSRSTIFEPFALFSDTQHSHYTVNIHWNQWAVNLDGVNAKWSFFPCSGTGTPEITIKFIHPLLLLPLLLLLLLLLLLALRLYMSSGLLNNSLPGFSIHSHLTPILNHLPQMLSHIRHSHPLFYIPHIYLVLHEMHCCHLPVRKVAKKIQESLRFTLAKHVSNIKGESRNEPPRRTKLPTSLLLHINLSPEQHLTLEPYGECYPSYKCYLLPKNRRLTRGLHAKEPYLMNMPCTVRAVSEHKKNASFCPYEVVYLYEGLRMFLAIYSINCLVCTVNVVCVFCNI
jgi:hypothetical protein